MIKPTFSILLSVACMINYVVGCITGYFYAKIRESRSKTFNHNEAIKSLITANARMEKRIKEKEVVRDRTLFCGGLTKETLSKIEAAKTAERLAAELLYEEEQLKKEKNNE